MSVQRTYVGDSGENPDLAPYAGKVGFLRGDTVSGIPNDLADRLGPQWVTQAEAKKQGVEIRTPTETQETQEEPSNAEANATAEGGDE